jgi:hypothetical protein
LAIFDDFELAQRIRRSDYSASVDATSVHASNPDAKQLP